MSEGTPAPAQLLQGLWEQMSLMRRQCCSRWSLGAAWMAWRGKPTNWSSSRQKRGEDCGHPGSSQKPHLPRRGPGPHARPHPVRPSVRPEQGAGSPSCPPPTTHQLLKRVSRTLTPSTKQQEVWWCHRNTHSLHLGSQPPQLGVTASTQDHSPHTGS